jgi:hypothetical protein
MTLLPGVRVPSLGRSGCVHHTAQHGWRGVRVLRLAPQHLLWAVLQRVPGRGLAVWVIRRLLWAARWHQARVLPGQPAIRRPGDDGGVGDVLCAVQFLASSNCMARWR